MTNAHHIDSLIVRIASHIPPAILIIAPTRMGLNTRDYVSLRVNWNTLRFRKAGHYARLTDKLIRSRIAREPAPITLTKQHASLKARVEGR